jgi:putative phosphoesterase
VTKKRIGLISDTHGLLRPEAVAFLEGCDHIIHAGDIGTPDIIDRLARIAPVTSVRGNNDKGAWADALAESELVQLGEHLIYVIHDIAHRDIDPRAGQAGVVISGHSHRPKVQRHDGVLYINPGSAGRQRFTLPISIGELMIDNTTIVARLARLVKASVGAAFVRDV